MRRPFRFGVLAGGAGSWVDSARAAEDQGYAIWLASDHLAGPKPAPMPGLAAVAATTSVIRVGTLVLGNDFRNPAQVAKAAATIDLISEGRFELGLGTGWLEDDYGAAGITVPPPGVRVDRIVEAVEVIKGFWSGRPFAFQGDHYRVEVEGHPSPVQRPYPPLLLAGSGPRMLRYAARVADIVSITATVGEGSRHGYRGAMLRAGHDVEDRVRWVWEEADPEMNVLVHHVSVTGSRRREAEQLGDGFADADTVLGSPHVLIGTVDEMVETLVERRERLGISYVVVGEEHMASFAPVVARLAGT